MRTRWSESLLFPLFVSMVIGVGSATSDAATRVYVRVGPPATVVQVRPVSPGPRYVWVEGYQRWDGRAYVWVPGRWAVPPRVRAVWVPGRWVHEHRGWFFVEGHWR